MSETSSIPDSLKVRIAVAFWIGVAALLACGAGVLFRIPILFLSGLGGVVAGLMAKINQSHLGNFPKGPQHLLNSIALGIGFVMGAGAILGAIAFVVFVIAIFVSGGPGHGRPIRNGRQAKRAHSREGGSWIER